MDSTSHLLSPRFRPPDPGENWGRDMTTSVPTSNLVETNSTSSTAPSTSKLVIMDECGFFRIHGCKYCLDMTSASFRSFPSMRFPRYNDMSAYDGACKVADTCGALSNKSLVSGYKTPSFPAIKKSLQPPFNSCCYIYCSMSKSLSYNQPHECLITKAGCVVMG